MENTEYKKANNLEEINIGDLIMIDTDTGNVTKAFLEKPFNEPINTRMVIGVCTSSDNETPLNKIIDGSTCKEYEREILEGGEEDTIIIEGGSASENPRTLIEICSEGEQELFITGKAEESDNVCVSFEAGKVMSMAYLDDEEVMDQFHSDLRTVGTIKEFIDEEQTKAIVELNIE